MGVHLSAASEGIADNTETEWSSPKEHCYYFPECITPPDILNFTELNFTEQQTC